MYYITRVEIKTKAKQVLENNIFSNSWLMLTLELAIISLISTAVCLVSESTFILAGSFSYAAALITLKAARGDKEYDIGDVFAGYKTDITQNLLLGLMTFLFTFLWTLLFIIPGIVKSYSYSMAFFIKVDHPDYDWKQRRLTTLIMIGNSA